MGKNAFHQMFTTKTNQSKMWDNQRKLYSDYHKLKIVWKSSPESLMYGNATQMAKVLIYIFPPLPCTQQLYLAEQCLSSGKTNGRHGFGKERNHRYLWVTFENPYLQQPLGDSFEPLLKKKPVTGKDSLLWNSNMGMSVKWGLEHLHLKKNPIQIKKKKKSFN